MNLVPGIVTLNGHKS